MASRCICIAAYMWLCACTPNFQSASDVWHFDAYTSDNGGSKKYKYRYVVTYKDESKQYNSPDIDKQTVVFARAMGADKDCDIVHYYPDRKIWFLEVGSGPWARLEPADALVSYCNASSNVRTQLIVPGELD